MIRDRVLPYQIGNYAHNNEWCCRSLINVGRVHDAVELAKNMIEQPRHPRLNTVTSGGSSAHYGRARLVEVLQRYELWDEAIAACEGAHLEPTDQFDEQIKRLRMLGRAYLGKGDVAKAKPVIADLTQRLADVKTQQDKAGQEAEDKIRAARKPAQGKDAKANDPKTNDPKVKAAEVKDVVAKSGSAKDGAAKEIKPNPAGSSSPPGKEGRGDGSSKEAKKLEQDLVKARNDARRPFDGKVAQLTQALDELNGRLAMLEGRHEEGLKLLEKANGMLKEHLAWFHSLAGKHDKAIQLAKQAKDGNRNEVHPLAVYVEVLHRAGKKDEARKAFDELLAISSAIDLDAPPIQRLAPIAKEFGLPADWRRPRETPGDLGQRPPLASLGPFRWQPVKAEDWTLPTGDGGKVSLADYRGKPVIVIFYLGYGCLHCAQQIEKFAPKAEEFRKAGVELVAVSSDTTADLDKSIKKYQAEKSPPRPFPMPLVADPELRVFRQYRAYDDFERAALHGTFLIDGQGLVRWQDIGYEPFMEADFLLAEAQRLLKQPVPRAEPPRTAAAGD
jgi:peroxiredoxin